VCAPVRYGGTYCRYATERIPIMTSITNHSAFARAKACSKAVGDFAHRHRKTITTAATTAGVVAWVLAPEPSGKIVGAALLARNLATLGFGSMRVGLAVAAGAPAVAGYVAGKFGNR